jgi:CRISPR-associated protein Cas8c/Csp2
MEFLHPYSRYGLALVMEENGLETTDEVNHEHLRNELIRGLNRFRIKPAQNFEGVEQVNFNHMTLDFITSNKVFQSKGLPNQGIFLSPNITSSDFQAGKTWLGTNALIKKLNGQKDKNENLTMSVFPMSGKFNNGKKSQSTPKALLTEVACAAITTTTPYKPCLTYRIFKGGKTERINMAIIPDLPLKKMIKFIALFKSIQSGVSNDLMVGKVSSKVTGKGDKEKTVYTPWRPKIFNGNFPNPPQSSALGSVALLGAIGEWAKKANFWKEGQEILESLINVPIYMVSYGNAKTFTYNHYVIELARENKLNRIIDAVYYSKLFNAENRSKSKNEYQSFDLFAGRFLQLFNRPAFKDFLAFRAEYPNELKFLFTTYFIQMEKINIEIVKSAKELGRWLNYVAFLAAKKEYPNTKGVEFKKTKAKILVEIESSVFSAKDGPSLIAQVITRAGRLAQNAISVDKPAQTSAPAEAALFIEATCSENSEILTLENAKNLLMAFSRLKNKYEKRVSLEEKSTENADKIDTSEYDED